MLCQTNLNALGELEMCYDDVPFPPLSGQFCVPVAHDEPQGLPSRLPTGPPLSAENTEHRAHNTNQRQPSAVATRKLWLAPCL